MDFFTDEVLAPTRTTRSDYSTVRERDELVYGDELLVDVSAYTNEVVSPAWCMVTGISPGSASVFPYKVQVPHRGIGQFRASEVRGWRRPLRLHLSIVESIVESAALIAEHEDEEVLVDV